jgi:hypothetical protein
MPTIARSAGLSADQIKDRLKGSVKATIAQHKPDTTVKVTTATPATVATHATRANSRAIRSIDNKMHHRLEKRRRLYVRSIAAAKDKSKIKVLQGKIDAIDFAVETLNTVLAEVAR